MLVARDLIKLYPNGRGIRGVSLQICEGEIVGLLGPNGAGKSTTFKCLTGFEIPDGGHIYVDNKEITYLPPYERAKLGVAFLPQEHSLFEDLTAFENIYMFAELIYPDKEKAEMVSVELLKDFNLYYVKDSKAATLSGGEKRRLEIARLFIRRPKYLLLDEPFAGIDPKHVEELKKLFLRLGKEASVYHDMGILITDHNVKEVFSFADRIYVISNGEVLFEGTPKEAAKDPQVRQVFLGEEFTY